MNIDSLTLHRRMKCLEFLYFYLLDETPSSSSSFTPMLLDSPQPTPPPTAPVTPIRPAKPYFSGVTSLRPKSCYGSSTYSFSSSSSLGGFSFSDSANSASSSKSSPSSSVGSMPKSVTKSLRSASGGSTNSFSSVSSDTSASTAASSVQSSPSLLKKSGSVPPPVFIPPDHKKSPVKAQRVVTPQNQTKNATSPPSTPPLQASDNANGKIFSFQPRPLMMLRREVDYVPQSPKKVLAVGVGRPPLANMGAVAPVALSIMMESTRRGHRKSLSASVLGSGITPPILQRKKSDGERTRRTITTLRGLGGTRLKAGVKEERQGSREKENEGVQETFWKTTEQKKALLGTMLGNVDALVEGVRKAGIWGLG